MCIRDRNRAFRKAIDTANARTVKVYGATAGRVDGYASGIIVSPDGLVLTMQGVFLEGSNVRVATHDGKIHVASVLRRDRQLQIALLKIEAETPDHFELAREEVGDKGDWVVTLSNAFKVADGVDPMSVNLGVISLRTSIEARLTERDVAYRGPIVLIDAITSNPGAAGGAVVTVDGNLVGLIGKVINSTETNTRLNYAVPSASLAAFVAGEKTTETTAVAEESGEPGDLGIQVFRMGGRRSPAYIDRIKSGSPAAAAGLKPDDLIIRMGGEKIATIGDFDKMMKKVYADKEVIILVTRGNDIIRVPLTAVSKEK